MGGRLQYYFLEMLDNSPEESVRKYPFLVSGLVVFTVTLALYLLFEFNPFYGLAIGGMLMTFGLYKPFQKK